MKRARQYLRHVRDRYIKWLAPGVTFLNVLRTIDQIQYVVDIYPRKHGKYIAGTGQKSVDRDCVKKYQPDVVIVMNPIYRNEIDRHPTKLYGRI